jgi:putative transcriptional regulator
MNKFYKSMKKGLQEALDFTEGKLTLKSELIQISEAPKKDKPKQIKEMGLRRRRSRPREKPEGG